MCGLLKEQVSALLQQLAAAAAAAAAQEAEETALVGQVLKLRQQVADQRSSGCRCSRRFVATGASR
jgi:cell division protein FtsB